MNAYKKVSKYLFPLVLVVATTILKFHFDPLLGFRTPFLLYTAVVIATTWYSGWAIGLVTNFICLAVLDYFFLEPYYSFLFKPRILIQMVVFTGQNLLLAAMGYTMKRALNKREAAENKFRLLVEQTCDMLVLNDVSGRAIYVSPKVIDLFGYTPEAYKAQSTERLYTAESLRRYEDSVKKISEEPGAIEFVKLQFIRQNGTLGWLEGNLFNYLDEPGIHAIVSNFRDITARIDVERQKDSFIAIASHELKTPLTSVKAYLQVMEVKAKKSQEPFFMEALSKVNHQVRKMTVMINGFLNLSRFESGKLHLDKEAFGFNQLIDEIVNECKLIITAHEISFAHGETDIMIVADRDKIGSVITNLISNAAKYSAYGKSIKINTSVKGNQVIFSIQDQGTGISPEHRNRVFERFYRIDNDQSKNVSGFGVGLYLSSQIVKLHRGEMWLNSEIGQGSTFYFSLPLDAPEKV